MKIFIPSDWFEDSFTDNVRVTLEGMGHEVMTLGKIVPAATWAPSVQAAQILAGYLRGEHPSRKDYRTLKLARKFRPDLVLALTGHLPPSILDDLGKACGRRRVLWWGDPPAYSRRWGIMDPGWDFVFLKDRATVEKLRLAGRNAFLLHEAMNPLWHKPLAEQKNGRIAVAGNYYAFRQALVLRLMGEGVPFHLYGPPPPRWADTRIRESHIGKYIVRKEKSLVFGEAMACLNTFPLAEGDSLNCRAFEIAGAGGLQFIEHRPAIDECFEPEKELFVFRTFEELLDLVSRARSHPEEMVPIRRAGVARALAEHTYRHRLETIIKTVA